MSVALWETLELEAGGASAGLLVPGRVLRALGVGLGIPAEDVGMIGPGRLGVAAVEVAAGRAAMLQTPRFVAADEGGRPAVFVLRRADERDEDARRELVVTWDAAMADAEAPTPGAIAVALAEAMAPRLGAEDVGFGLQGVGYLRVQVPLGAALSGVPAELRIGSRTLGVELAEKKTWAR